MSAEFMEMSLSVPKACPDHTCGMSTLQLGERSVCDPNKTLCGLGTVKNGTLFLLFFTTWDTT